MSWKDIRQRMLPPIGGFYPHDTSAFGVMREDGPHKGVDSNYNVGPKGQTGINLTHPALRSPVDGIVTNAGQGTAGRIAIRDANGFTHELLHTDRRYVAIGDPVAAGQLVGTMGNTGAVTGHHHLHTQLKGPAGNVLNPTAFFDAQGPVDPNPAPPALLREYLDYLRAVGSNTSEAGPTIPNAPSPFGTRGEFVPGSATSSQPLYDTRSFVPPSAESVPERNVRRLVRVPKSAADRLTGAPPPNQLPTGDAASFDDRFGRWTVSPEASAPLGPYQGVPVSPDGRPLGIFTGQPMRDYPFPPPIWGFPEEEAKQGSEYWAGRKPKSANWNKKVR